MRDWIKSYADKDGMLWAAVCIKTGRVVACGVEKGEVKAAVNINKAFSALGVTQMECKRIHYTDKGFNLIRPEIDSDGWVESFGGGKP